MSRRDDGAGLVAIGLLGALAVAAGTKFLAWWTVWASAQLATLCHLLTR